MLAGIPVRVSRSTEKRTFPFRIFTVIAAAALVAFSATACASGADECIAQPKGLTPLATINLNAKATGVTGSGFIVSSRGSETSWFAAGTTGVELQGTPDIQLGLTPIDNRGTPTVYLENKAGGCIKKVGAGETATFANTDTISVYGE